MSISTPILDNVGTVVIPWFWEQGIQVAVWVMMVSFPDVDAAACTKCRFFICRMHADILQRCIHLPMKKRNAKDRITLRVKFQLQQYYAEHFTFERDQPLRNLQPRIWEISTLCFGWPLYKLFWLNASVAFVKISFDSQYDMKFSDSALMHEVLLHTSKLNKRGVEHSWGQAVLSIDLFLFHI